MTVRIDKLGVSIIICCHNSAQRLPETLQHLKVQQVRLSIPWEVILVDNASTDGTAEYATQFWDRNLPTPLRVVHENKLGLTYARLCGKQEANYEFLSFIDDDNWVSPDWVSTVYEIMSSHPQVGACGGDSIPVFESAPPYWFQQFHKSFAIGTQDEKEGILDDQRSGLWGAGLTIRRSAWEQVDEAGWSFFLTGRKGTALTGGEDTELCYWLRFLGWDLFYSPKLTLQHFIPVSRTSWEYLVRNSRSSGYSKMVLKLYKKEFQRSKSLVLRPWFGFVQWMNNVILYCPIAPNKLRVLFSGNKQGNAEYLLVLSDNSIFRSLLRTGPFTYNKLLKDVRKFHLLDINND